MHWIQSTLQPRHIPPPSRAVGAMLVLLAVALVAVGSLWRSNRALRSELQEQRRIQRASEGREQDLNGAVAEQHRRLLDSEAEMEMLEFRMQGVEMQLDGVDLLSQEIRNELGLPASAGTWGDGTTEELPQGGARMLEAPESRVVRLSRRVSYGYGELSGLLDTLRARDREPGAVAESAPERVVEPPLNWPVRGTVTSGFGWRVFHGRPNHHTGIDVAVPFGTAVQATATGEVVGSGWQPGYGWSVLVRHMGGYHTLYAHLSGLAVKVGDTVRTADVVGISGSSGHSTGPHLHYEIWKDGALENPRPYMDGSGPR